MKRSRVVTSSDIPEPSPSSTLFRTTCTNNNARRLAQAHAVTLRSSRNRDRNRQTQLSLHTAFQTNTELSDNESQQLDGDDDDHADAQQFDGGSIDLQADGAQEDSNSDVLDGPKRPAVNFLPEYIEKNTHTTFAQPRPCQDWLPYRREYLDEMHRHDGLTASERPLTCPDCAMQDGVIKCIDCLPGALKCGQCAVNCHGQLPLHRLQVCDCIQKVIDFRLNAPPAMARGLLHYRVTPEHRSGDPSWA